MLRNFKNNHQSGFTIIEVLIVLAIAGLIMVAVFTAVPALQRSSRNNQRKSSASQIMASISSYVANNNGALPASSTLQTALNDYKPGFYPTAQVYYGSSTTIPTSAAIGGVGSTGTLTTEDAIFISNAVCDSTTGTTATASGASSRSYVVIYAVESGTSTTPQCIGS